MEVFESFEKTIHGTHGAVIAIGNFDGVHLGHVALLGQAKKIAQQTGKLFGVLTFEPHPKRLFRPDDPPNRIAPPALKAKRLKEFGVDILFSIPFDWDFASQSPEGFIQNVLIDGIGASHVVVGYDFKFGQMRKGTPGDMEAAGLPVTIVDQQSDDQGEPLSSSRIRQSLRQGKLDQANQILGWDWEIWGIVQKGDQRGREFGYPTANFPLKDEVHPRYGVYASRVQIGDEGEWFPAATNIGIRPMFESKIALVETFIFDFNREIYGDVLKVRPVQFLRGEAKFESLDDLIKQMDEDCAQARKILS